MRHDPRSPDLPGSLWTLVLARTPLVSELPLGFVSLVNDFVDVDVDGLPLFWPVTELTFTPDSFEAPFGIRRGPLLRTKAMTQSMRIATDMLMHNSETYMPNDYIVQEGFHPH